LSFRFGPSPTAGPVQALSPRASAQIACCTMPLPKVRRRSFQAQPDTTEHEPRRAHVSEAKPFGKA